MARTIESPGVQITEIDLSLRGGLPIGTNILINGVTDQGPSQELLNVTSIEEYEQIYGVPTNAAERYAYHTVKQVLQTPAKLLFNRLPYGNTGGGEGYDDSGYSVLMYPVYTVTPSTTGAIEDYSVLSGDYLVGRPTQTVISEAEYISWQQGGIEWGSLTKTFSGGDADRFVEVGKPEDAGIIVINKLQTTVNQDFEGYFVGLSDNTQSSTSGLTPDVEFTSIKSIETGAGADGSDIIGNDWNTLSDTRLSFALSGNITDTPDSISEAIESAPTWDFGAQDYRDGLIIGLYKFARSGYTSEENALRFAGVETHVGSLGADRKYTHPTGFQETTFFLEKLVDQSSTYLDVMVNPNLSKGNWLTDEGVPSRKVNVLTSDILETLSPSNVGVLSSDAGYTLGTYKEKAEVTKDVGAIKRKLELGLRLADDWEVYPLDIVLDAGLSTIHTTTTILDEGGEFDDTKPVPMDSDAEMVAVEENWATIVGDFDTFCRDTRKDCMFIADCYRNILLKGKNYKTLTDKSKNFSQDIYSPLKQLTANINSNYSAFYAQWLRVFDNTSNDFTWVPYSGFQGAIMAKLDSKLYAWSAPAGLENGIVTGAVDVALQSTQKQRDLLYRNNINAVVDFPNEGIVCWGQKTLQKKPSAFDRINVRRLFLALEKSTRSLMKYFVFQPNTVFTRTRVVNILTPIFDVAKNNEGVYDYRIICDGRNNTPSVIDANEMVVDIYLKPVRTAEFILVNFYATRTDQSFDELI